MAYFQIYFTTSVFQSGPRLVERWPKSTYESRILCSFYCKNNFWSSVLGNLKSKMRQISSKNIEGFFRKKVKPLFLIHWTINLHCKLVKSFIRVLFNLVFVFFSVARRILRDYWKMLMKFSKKSQIFFSVFNSINKKNFFCNWVKHH